MAPGIVVFPENCFVTNMLSHLISSFWATNAFCLRVLQLCWGGWHIFWQFEGVFDVSNDAPWGVRWVSTVSLTWVLS